MPMPLDLVSARRALELLARARLRPSAPPPGDRATALVVDVERQIATLIEADLPVAAWPVSTASAGIGSAEGSNRTPPGWHRIHDAIGARQRPRAVFVSRKPTGRVWEGGAEDGDLILTRILTLEGLEPGINQGPGRDSLERYIYLHGTNHEDEIGTPASHGCVRLTSDDILDLFARVRPGDPVVVVGGEDPAMPDPLAGGRFHYAGIGGSGMSALAQFQAMRGGRASGSDRSFDRGDRGEARAQLERLGITLHPQDGSGLAGAAALVVSSAVEDKVPDVVSARAGRIPILHRSEMLAHFVRTHRTLAVSGTSGKSTVVAMIFDILRGAGRDPSVITGGDLRALQREGLWGNAWAGGELLVIEADESDGTLVRYEPAVSVILNLQRDHKEMDEVAAMFATFRDRTREGRVVGEGANLADLARGATVFGFGPGAAVRGENVTLEPGGSRFTAQGVPFHLPVPGRHNVENALAAIAACRAVDVPLEAMAAPLAGFEGVGRRFHVLGAARGIEVVDDFAHNPAKIAAAIATAQARCQRVLAVYQPHGYGPTRFLRRDFVETFAACLRPADRLWLLEVFYAGGTAIRDFSAADIVAEAAARGAGAEFAPSREWLRDRLLAEARAGDLVLVMGARDPSLTEWARSVLDSVASVTA